MTGQKKAHAAAMTITTLLTLGALCAGTQAADLDSRHAWTTVGSVGVADERDEGKIRRSGSYGGFSMATPQTSAVLRYNINATDALVGDLADGESWQLRVHYRCRSSNDRVRVFLKQRALDGNSGDKILAVLDSDQQLHESDATFRDDAVQVSGMDFDFEQNAYLLEVMLSKYAPGPGAGIIGASIQRAGSAE